MVPRETTHAPFRLKDRFYVNLTNEELQLLFNHRASKVQLDPKGFWECDKIVYWSVMIPILMDLYEIMLEIQARYPRDEIMKYPGAFDLLPVPVKWMLKNGLKELNKSKE